METLESPRSKSTDAILQELAVATTPPRHAPRAPLAVAERKFTLTTEQVQAACEGLSDPARQAVKWAAHHCRTANLSFAEFGAQLKQPGTDRPYSGDSIYQVFTGRRDAGSMDRFTESVAVLRRRQEETGPRTGTLFIETSLSRKIWALLDKARARRKITFVFSESQVGKTTACAEYAARHDETILVRMPTGGSMSDFLPELAIRLGLGDCHNQATMKRAIMECFDEHTLLIVDECEQCIDSGRESALRTVEFCREIYDRRRCGVVLVAAPRFLTALRTNRTLTKLWRRGYRPLVLPATPSAEALDQFAAHFGLDPAPERRVKVAVEDAETGREREVILSPLELQSAMILQQGLGRWLSILEDAAEMAAETDKRMTWGKVIAAAEEFRTLDGARN